MKKDPFNNTRKEAPTTIPSYYKIVYKDEGNFHTIRIPNEKLSITLIKGLKNVISK